MRKIKFVVVLCILILAFVGSVEARKAQFKKSGDGSVEDFKDRVYLSVEYGLEEIFEFYNSKINVNSSWTKEDTRELKKIGWNEVYEFCDGILYVKIDKGTEKDIFSRKTKTAINLFFLRGPLSNINCYCFFEGNKLKVGSYRDFAIFRWLQKKGIFGKILDD